MYQNQLIALLSLLLCSVVYTMAHDALSNSAGDSRTIVLITGCSSGIGKSVALEFASRQSVKVYATMRDISKWSVSETPSNIVLANLDVTSEASIAAVVDQIIRTDGKIDILINNAGYAMAGSLEMATIKEAQDLFDVNVWGVVRMLQAVLPHMRGRKSGHIINLSSTSGIRGIPCMEFYTGSKFALEGIMDSLRHTLAAYNIFVTNVNAGPVRTALTERFGDVTKGGRGTRVVPNDSAGFMSELTDKLIVSLNRRMESSEAQTSEEAAKVILNIAILGRQATKISDVPFNTGTKEDSQHVLEHFRKFPSGWGGLYNAILKTVPEHPEGSSKIGLRSEL